MGESTLLELSTSQRAALKVSYTVRALDVSRPTHALAGPGVRPQHGDVLIATVTDIGKHDRLELANGRRAHLFPGDAVLLAYADRYAPDQFHAEVPAGLGPCHLAAAGGIAAEVTATHTSVGKPTGLIPVGLAADHRGTRLTMTDLAAPPAPLAPRTVPTIAVTGTSMNSGKTSTGAALIRGLAMAGYAVGAAKITGTGAGGDRWLFADSGAREVLDFTDAGLASTYRVSADRILGAARSLRDRLVRCGVEVIVLEVADGVLQQESAELLRRKELRAMVDAWLFAAGDAAGALFGRERMRAVGLPVAAVSGRITASPLATREAAERLDVPVYGLAELADPMVASQLATVPSAAEPATVVGTPA